MAKTAGDTDGDSNRPHYSHRVTTKLMSFSTNTPLVDPSRARNMPVAVAKETQKVVHDDQVDTATENHGEDHVRVDELVAMDYSPATRKPPIHN
ncbi:hypothetical protein V6N13_044537 [Hibiscus sabdariffa]